MQGMARFVPTSAKVEYLNQLLKCGFDTLDFGSFVSSKAIPQMRDTKDVLKGLSLNDSKTKLLAIVANERGGEEALAYEEISFLGYPLSISKTFQKRNTNASIDFGFELVKRLTESCDKGDKKLVVYISMAFGNPYGEDYSENMVVDCFGTLTEMGVGIISIADTIGTSTPWQIESLVGSLMKNYPNTEIGAHLHSTPKERLQKVLSLKKIGCRRIDGAILGFGGCPMAKDDLTGNLPTEIIVDQLDTGISKPELDKSIEMARFLFN